MESLFDRAAETTRTQVKKMRWALGLHGLASLALGVMILAWPGISVFALTIVFGAYTLATGIVELGAAFSSQYREERGWLILRGLLGITVGVVVSRLAQHLGPRTAVCDRRLRRRARDPGRRGVVEVSARRSRHRIDGPDRPRIDRVRNRDLRDAGCRRTRRTRTDRSVRARHGSHRARRRDQRREAARAEGKEDLRVASEVDRRRLRSRRIDGRSVPPHVHGAGDQLAGSACALQLPTAP